MTADHHREHVLSYFRACDTGNIDDLKRHFTPDIVHYFLPAEHPPVRGADHLAAYWSKMHRVYHPKWRIDHIMADEQEAVSEWSCAYTEPRDGKRYVFRGTEWYVFRGQLISEIRAYYKWAPGEDCELNGFPYANRDYLKK